MKAAVASFGRGGNRPTVYAAGAVYLHGHSIGPAN